jgi:class 3 adenylate cyclase/tetratricopeptide (TPR) repeat protein
VNCPSCGTPRPDGARFCPSCGQAFLSRADERRVVSVLFADLVGFTTIGETMDPEQLKNIVDRCFARLAEDVTSFGGRVDKVMGDAIMALFGAPVAHEDDAERAVRAALQMQTTVEEASEDLGIDLRLRVGVDSGEVLVGALSAGGDYTAMGDVVNVASRLQTMAAPGQILVGEATHEATSRVVRYDDQGERRARGRGEGVQAWAALECLAPPGYRPRRRGVELVGRTDEMGLLRHAAAVSAGRRRAQLILLVGEAGVGKSRLAEELADWTTRSMGATVVSGRCPPYGEANPWWPVAEAIRQASAIELSDSAAVSRDKCRRAASAATGLADDSAELGRLVAGLSYLMGDEDAMHDVDPARAPDEARRSLFSFFEGLSRRAPLVFVLHALHLADPLVVGLVDELLARPGHLPLLVVATAGPDIAAAWSARRGPHNEVVIHVDPLDAPSTRRLLGLLTGNELPPSLAEILVERSGGNPLYLEELASLLGDSATVAMAETVELPATLRGLVAARLDSLGVEERAVLEDASVVGHDGSLAALVALGRSRGGDDVVAVVERLASKDQLSLDRQKWSFRSELAREVAYETLTKAGRAQRHYRLAQWMAERAHSTDREHEVIDRLAHHYAVAAELAAEVGRVPGVASDVATTAVDHLGRAAHLASEKGLNTSAARLLDRALELAPAVATTTRRSLLVSRAVARNSLREVVGARADIDAALALVGGPVDEATEARALSTLGQVQRAEGSYDDSIDTLERALQLWEVAGDRLGRAETLSQIGLTRFFSGESDDAEVAIGEARQIFGSLGSRRYEAWALWNLAWIAFSNARLEAAEEKLAEATDAFVAAGDWGGRAWAMGLLAFIRLFEGRRDEAEALVEEVAHDVGDGDRWAQAMVLFLTSTVRLWQGRTVEAFAPGFESRRLFHALGDAEGELRSIGTLSLALAATGQVEAALDLGEEAVALAGASTGGTHLSPATALTLRRMAALGAVRVAIHVGEPTVAISFAQQVSAGPGVSPGAVTDDFFLEEWAIAIGAALTQAGRFDEAVDALRATAEANEGGGSRAGVLSCLALARAALGEADEACELETAVASMPEATYNDTTVAHLAAGLALARRGDDEGARARLSQAAAAVEATGDLLLQAVSALGASLALCTLGDPAGPADLSDARAHLERMGTAAPGWETAFAAVLSASGAAGWPPPAPPARSAAP